MPEGARDPKVVLSPLSQTVSCEGHTVDVHIFRLENDSDWILEVVNENSSSTVWPEPFQSDADAFAEFLRVVEHEGLETFIEGGQPKSFPL